jgi:hypothetical protein
VEHKAIRDNLTFLAQLGVIEPSAPEFIPFFQALTVTAENITAHLIQVALGCLHKAHFEL